MTERTLILFTGENVAVEKPKNNKDNGAFKKTIINTSFLRMSDIYCLCNLTKTQFVYYCSCVTSSASVHVLKRNFVRYFAPGKTKNRAGLLQCGEPQNPIQKDSFSLRQVQGSEDLLCRSFGSFLPRVPNVSVCIWLIGVFNVECKVSFRLCCAAEQQKMLCPNCSSKFCNSCCASALKFSSHFPQSGIYSLNIWIYT